jgi:membrane-associated phospholipid phosphatase
MALAIGAALTAVLASTPVGTNIDRSVLDALATRRYSSVWNIAQPFNNHLEALVALITAAGCTVAYIRSGRRQALLIGATVVVSGGLAEILKRLAVVDPPVQLLDRAGPSWPSAHAAAITAVAVTLSIVPRNSVTRRLMAMVSPTAVLGCSLSLVVARSHRPTDLLGGSFLACAVAATATAVLQRSGRTAA